LHSKDLPFHWGALICDPPAPCAKRRLVDLLLICYCQDYLSRGKFFYFVSKIHREEIIFRLLKIGVECQH
jgi:hypothetical protein